MLKYTAGTLALCAGLALAMSSAPAEAREKRDRHAYQERYRAEPRRVCQRLCRNDTNPCDPLYFKTADGRCNFDNNF